jgi:hypothetical protein
MSGTTERDDDEEEAAVEKAIEEMLADWDRRGLPRRGEED